jgi:hypothetical protein
MLGTVQECNTSTEVTINIDPIPNGIHNRLSTSNKRNLPEGKSEVGII